MTVIYSFVTAALSKIMLWSIPAGSVECFSLSVLCTCNW